VTYPFYCNFRNNGNFYLLRITLRIQPKIPEGSRKSGNCWISEEWTIQPKIRWDGNFQEKNLVPHEVVLFFGKRVNLQFCIQHLFFWPRSQRVGHPRQRWRRRVFENGLIFYFRILPLVCRSIVATAKFIKKAFNSNKNNAPWFIGLFCRGWLRNVRRFLYNACRATVPLSKAFIPFVSIIAIYIYIYIMGVLQREACSHHCKTLNKKIKSRVGVKGVG